jgi:hypothetical protein
MERENNAYEICGKGHLDRRWASWFEELEITHAFIQDGTPVTKLIGPVRDQAALHGLLAKLRDIGIPILSINRIWSWKGHEE